MIKETHEATIAKLLTLLDLPEDIADQLEWLTKEVVGFLFAVDAWNANPQAQSILVAERLQHYAAQFSVIGAKDGNQSETQICPQDHI